MEEGGFLHPKSCNLQLEALSESTLTIQYGQELISRQDDFLTEWLMALHIARRPVKADERLLNLLKLLVNRLGRRTKEGCTLSFLLSHSRLAEIIGTTRSTVSRSMAKLRKTDPSRSKSQEDYSTLKTEQTNRSQPNKDITRDRNGKIHLSTWNILIFYSPFSLEIKTDKLRRPDFKAFAP